ncbi:MULTISPECIES: sensor histidine kinase [Microbacterium]|uniref:sensor histidine kinase n=1 Tax=Microbacterium TaxID=33882 RepID=UPI00217DAF37|nr:MULTISPECIES: HAMP domain-containing sensor histidine kinase [Microbacterium]UWF77045.1 HAMP domain-containing histidine kinase [Microbacterium neungamense]WCM55205.1 HAMP domain-containing histidine kinase [Microbacterium sp. EF45047]
MAHKPDAVTSWWRRISLRAKVTGVTVAVLALGLVVAGIGTVPILRNALISNIDAQLPDLAKSGIAERWFDIASEGGTLVFTPKETAPRSSDYVFAVYGANGTLLARGGGSGASDGPVFPRTLTLEAAHALEDRAPIPLESEDGAAYHGAVFVDEGPGAYYIQFVALPLEEADRIIATYFGVYTTVALVTILLAALLIRGLVTLTFRRLGHVEATAMAIAAGDFSQRLTDLEPSTEVGRLNAAINTMLDRVDRSLAQRDRTVQNMRRFIGDASHELRTPLVSVRGYAELYRMGAIRGEEDTARAMERIEKEAIRMGVLVEDLLALARLDEEREREIRIEPLDLRPIARDAALDVRVASPGRTVTVIDTTAGDAPPATTAPIPIQDAPPAPRPRPGVALSRLRRRPRPAPEVPSIDFTETTDAPVRTPPIVLGEDNKVRQVVTNLLGNARRFSPDDSPIEIVVGADRRRGVGTIAVVDHGEGIPPQIREHIFERFWRADTSRARETGGAGLGLAIVASIVDALNGSVTVDETPGGGATFTVALPLAPPQATPEHLLEETQPLDRLEL